MRAKPIAIALTIALFSAGSCAFSTTARADGEPTVVFDAVDQNGAQVLSAKVSVDGAPVQDGINGHAVPLAVGAHVAHFEAAGHTAVDVPIDVQSDDDHRLIHATLPATDASGDAVKKDAPLDRRFGVAPWIVMGSGAVVLGVGIGLLVSGLSDIHDAESRCPNRVCAKQADTDEGQGGIAKATAGRVLVPVGAITFAGALVLQLVFNAPPRAAPAVAIDRDSAVFSVVGTF